MPSSPLKWDAAAWQPKAIYHAFSAAATKRKAGLEPGPFDGEVRTLPWGGSVRWRLVLWVCIMAGVFILWYGDWGVMTNLVCVPL